MRVRVRGCACMCTIRYENKAKALSRIGVVLSQSATTGSHHPTEHGRIRGRAPQLKQFHVAFVRRFFSQ